MILYHGNCLEEMDKIADKSVDLILTDLPYGTTACTWDIVIPFEPMWKQFKRIRKGAIALFGTEPFSSLLRVSNLKEYKYDWVWDKVTARGHLVANNRPMQQTEIISIFGGLPYYPQMTERPESKFEYRHEYARTTIMGGEKKELEEKIYKNWYPKNLISISNANSSVTGKHPTEKPIELLEYLIKTYTEEGQTVLDCCMGSGSTGIACLNTKREFIGIEMYPLPGKEIDSKNNPDWFNIAKDRLDRHQFKPATKPDKYGNLSLF